MAIFSVVMVSSLGALIAMMNANRKSQTLKLVMNNLTFSLEKMSRDIRSGSVYHCDIGTGDPTQTRDCVSGASSLAFVNKSGQKIFYLFNGTTLEMSDDGGTSYSPFTSNLIQLNNVRFYVQGTDQMNSAGTDIDKVQPIVFVVLSGYAGLDPRSRSEFSIQTVIERRGLDVP